MAFDNFTFDFEKERLHCVCDVIGKQLDTGIHAADKFKKDVIHFQKSMWDNVNPTPTSGDMDDLANIWQFQTDLVREGSKAIFYSNRVEKLRKMLKNPYFARIDFKEEECEDTELIYIGISNLYDEKRRKYLVYDWRAPISSMFYDYEPGMAGYDCPAGLIQGEIKLKRQYRIWNGEIQFMFDSSLAISDEILQEILGKSADSRMKTIVTSIQREQNRIIRNDTHKLLAVTGPAGSGKTSIALHRAAYLLYRYRDTISSDNIVIFSPNDIFSDYISDVLPELGEENINRSTLLDYAEKTLEKGLVLEDGAGQMEYLLCEKDRAWHEPQLIEEVKSQTKFYNRVKGIIYKSSPQIISDLKDYVNFIEETCKFYDVYFNDVLIETEEEISLYFRKELKFLPVVKRLEKIRNRLTEKLDLLVRKRIEEVILEVAKTGEYINASEIRGRSISIVHGEAEPARTVISEMTDLNLPKSYNYFLEYRAGIPDPMGFCFEKSITVRDNTTGTYEKNCIKYEDIAPLLLLKGLLYGFPNMDRIKHVIVDEVQDYTPVQLEIFKGLFGGCDITLLGDSNQAIGLYTGPFTLDSVFDIFGNRSSIALKLDKSYRSTKQITEFCRDIIKSAGDTEFVNREGKLPEIICAADLNGLYAEAAKDIENLKAEGMKSIAVIMRTERLCHEAFKALAKYVEPILVTSGSLEFSTGITIIPSYLSKGLEFDAVLVLCADPGTYDCSEETRLAYTVCTRALHRLNIYCPGGFPGFLKNVDKKYYQIAGEG